MLVMSGSKSDEEREFYMRFAVKERYRSRQIERQMDSGYYERFMLYKKQAAAGTDVFRAKSMFNLRMAGNKD